MDISGLDFVRGVELNDGRFVLASQVPTMNIKTDAHTGMVAWTRGDGWTEIGLSPRITVDMTTGEEGDTYV